MDPLDARSVDELVAAVSGGQRVKWLHFWGHTPKGERVGQWCLSQWWPAVFEDEAGVRFASAEHYMMWRKAVLFGDDDAAGRVLAARTPAAAKDLGRRVRGFDDAAWTARRWEVVVTGSTLKFGQDPALRDYLLSTRGRVLVEASPVDRVWGIGLAADSEHAEQPDRWRGLNLLGFALMEARAALEDAS
ncbi:NADAR family protein [Nocardioides halotolerans]|jgi:ribA/ribD-fused uncharacterized protein|uniref:NADAR family protein n=1 Tax=Nocardioides halotolerans TaxID=433660 RepID=UPI000400E7A5|nr:NADAR family protein [Nocardioides halotolerans]